MADETFAGPIDFLVFGFPPGSSVGEGLSAVLERVNQGIVEILDLECIVVDDAGTPATKDLADFQDLTDFDLSVFDGAASNVLDAEDLASIAETMEPGWFAIALVYEDRSLAAAGAAWVRAGGEELLSGGVDMEDLAVAVEHEH